MATDELLI